MTTIQKGIPFPTSRVYPFPKMNVGDSFVVGRIEYKRLSFQASTYGKKHNKKFSIRSILDGVRCWRVR